MASGQQSGEQERSGLTAPPLISSLSWWLEREKKNWEEGNKNGFTVMRWENEAKLIKKNSNFEDKKPKESRYKQGLKFSLTFSFLFLFFLHRMTLNY